MTQYLPFLPFSADLSGCCLTAFPTGLILATSSVSDKISSISLANNELKGMTKKFFTTYKNMEGK